MYSSGLLFISNLFSSDMIIIMVVALFLFGGEKLPEIARGLGKGIRDFKDASDGIKREINNQIYNYEEKQEQKKIEEKSTADQTETQNAPAESSSINLIKPVENTIPASEGYIYTGESTGINHPADDHNNVLNGNHSATHDEAASTGSETTKNS
ncbi:twin arginine translocase protein A [Mucilaginibacter gotjawali]|uniref:Twin arginine translocase protein A n=2 Tax=Mucilaginibacter gotjawali TaxID=1550579 RepID=A0A110B3Y5_9SPHI|nr:twin arginine translocase protein A [Mucilaginibacter gotjawali]